MRSDGEIIRSALLAGLDWERSRLEAGAGHQDIVQRNLKEFEHLLRKYGGAPVDPFKDAPLIDIRDVK